MKRYVLSAVLASLSVVFGAHAQAGTLTASIANVPPFVPVSPVAPTPASVLAPTVSLAHTGTVGGPNFTAVSVSLSYNAIELSFVGTASLGWSCGGSAGLVVCSGPDIPVNQTRSLVPEFTVRGGSGTTGTQIVAAPSGTDGGSPILNIGMAGFSVTDRTDLGLSAPASVAVAAGASVSVSVNVLRNSGDPSNPANLWTNVRVGLNFPSSLRYGGATAAGWTCPASSGSPGGTFQCTRSSNATGVSPEQISVLVFGVTAGANAPLNAQLQHDSEDLNAGNNAASTIVNVGALGADLNPTFLAPTTVVNGASFGFTLEVSNNGPGVATSVQADLSLDTNLTVLSAASGCVLQGPSIYRCTASSLAASALLSFPFTVRHVGAAQGIPVGGNVVVSAAEPDPISNNNSNVFQVNVTPSSDLALSLQDSADPVEPDVNFVVQAAVRNVGPDDASAIVLIFDLPSNASYVDSPAPGGPGLPMSCTPIGGDEVHCLLSALSLGQSGIAAIRLAAPGSGSVVTSANVDAEQSDLLLSNNSDSETTLVREPARLTLRKTASSANVQVGTEFFYSLAVANVGSSAATGLIVQDSVPAGQTITAVEGGSFNCTTSAQDVDCRMATLEAGASSSITIRVRAPTQPATAVNTAAVTSTQVFTPVSSSATVEFISTTVVDLQLVKQDSTDPVAPGTTFDYELLVSNNGSGPASGFSISDTLPSGLVFISASGNDWTCSGVQTLNCSYSGSLAANSSSILRISVRAPLTESELINTASLSVLPGETNTENNSDSESTRVRSATGGINLIDLSLSGELSSVSPQAGEEVQISLVARNNDSSISAADVVLCGLLTGPSGALQLLSLSAPGVSCAITGGAVSCQIPSLGNGQSLAFVGTARVTSGTAVGTTLGADLQLSCGRTDANPLDNAVSLRAVVAAPPASAAADMSVLLTESIDPVPLTEDVDFRIEVRNVGPGVADGIVVATSLGAGFRFDGFVGAGWACQASGSSVNCQLAGTLAGQGSSVITLNTTALGPAGTFESVALVSTTSIDPLATNNRSALTTVIGAAIDPESIEENLLAATLLDPIAADAAPVIADICARPIADFAAQCNALVSAAARGNQQEVVDGLRALFPEEVAAQSLSLSQAAASQFGNVDARLNELRGGRSGFSVSGFALGLGRQTLPMGLLSGLLDDGDEDPEIGGAGDLISPWGGFVNGTLSRGEQDTGDGSRRVVSDFESYGLTAGVDYRRSARWVLGAAVGYADFSSDITDGGQLDTKGFTLTGYSAWYPREQFYIDARVSYAILDLDMLRLINFSSGGFVLDQVATGSTESSQLSFAAASGYHFSRGSWTITPNASLRYVNSQVDGFSETGAGANSVVFGDQDIDSLQFSVGLQVSRVFSLANGVLAPQFDLSFSREMRDEDLVIEARLAGAAADQLFQVRAEEPDHSFGNVGLGFVYIAANGRQMYVSYRELLGAQGTDRGTLTIGGRFEF